MFCYKNLPKNIYVKMTTFTVYIVKHSGRCPNRRIWEKRRKEWLMYRTESDRSYQVPFARDILVSGGQACFWIKTKNLLWGNWQGCILIAWRVLAEHAENSSHCLH